MGGDRKMDKLFIVEGKKKYKRNASDYHVVVRAKNYRDAEKTVEQRTNLKSVKWVAELADNKDVLLGKKIESRIAKMQTMPLLSKYKELIRYGTIIADVTGASCRETIFYYENTLWKTHLNHGIVEDVTKLEIPL